MHYFFCFISMRNIFMKVRLFAHSTNICARQIIIVDSNFRMHGIRQSLFSRPTALGGRLKWVSVFTTTSPIFNIRACTWRRPQSHLCMVSKAARHVRMAADVPSLYQWLDGVAARCCKFAGTKTTMRSFKFQLTLSNIVYNNARRNYSLAAANKDTVGVHNVRLGKLANYILLHGVSVDCPM